MEDKKITAEELLEAMDFDLKDMAQKVADVINNATPGAIIAESEEPVRDANAEFRQRLYQKAIDLLDDKQEAFSPSAQRAPEQGQAIDNASDGQRTSDDTEDGLLVGRERNARPDRSVAGHDHVSFQPGRS